ncbi:2OG-Fe(II) oxygenase [Leptolyngbya sp. FACHB-17]|uniref:2OG-Fe(II) oxygenase n=1 Tax=unclassified Leptolyngbya TaxID=2650499 RepID=UPI0016819759|nr:2OG-Fe(II) oxygenase [Leptolyngbya sp. FACHB-17]MBD2081770.1 2OG-Fe(II) oxygenase [Leptolyngbya sp. FACHB-17]
MTLTHTLNNIQVVRDPFPYIIIDNFLDDDLAHQIERNFPKPEEMPRHSPDYGLLDGWHLNPRHQTIVQRASSRSLFKLLESPEFRKYMQEVFGVEQPLFCDPLYQGAGFLTAKKGGVHKIHRDRNRHLNTHFYRRLTLLTYFNRGWQPGYGGELNLWDRKIKQNVVIEPLFNRCVVFENTRYAFHSVSDVTLPAGMTRKAINFYYYTELPAPEERHTHIHDTEFFAAPGEKLQFWKYVALTRFPILLIDTAINRNEAAARFLQKTGLRSLYLRTAAATLKIVSPKKYQKLLKSSRWNLFQKPDYRLIEYWKRYNNQETLRDCSKP